MSFLVETLPLSNEIKLCILKSLNKDDCSIKQVSAEAKALASTDQ
jgi:hypothetical protein